MAVSTSGSKSLKEYLKRYESNAEEEKKNSKRKKKKIKTKSNALGVLVVDEDPVWQKPVNIGEEEPDESADEEKPQIDEDIEVKRMKRLEQLRARRPYNSISEDGSGWVSFSPQQANSSVPDDMSPPRKSRARNDTPSPEPLLEPLDSNQHDDLSPPRERRNHHNHSLSPEPNTKPVHSAHLSSDLSPLRKQRARNDTPSPRPESENLARGKDVDLSPPRHQRLQRRHHHIPSPEPDRKKAASVGLDSDVSPPRRPHRHTTKVSGKGNYETQKFPDKSPPRRGLLGSPYSENTHISHQSDLSPPRKSRKNVGRNVSPDTLPRYAHRRPIETDVSHASQPDTSPPRKNQKGLAVLASSKEQPKTGLISGREIREEIAKTKKDHWLRFEEMDPSISGRGAEPVYRDKIKGERISKEEYLKSKEKVEEKPKEKKLEWGKGLAQKREAEAKLQELELEKDKPFARTRDDPDLDKLLKERVRWGDPMSHLVQKKYSDLVLINLGDSEKMKESGFVVPQDIPPHSWLKRGLDAAPNRYGIRPGRHWDGVDRSNGFEKEMFKRTNEKQATEREAYLWSVSDM